ncbi:MAG: serine/threonine protein kinase [Nitrospiraceae bacterium]
MPDQPQKIGRYEIRGTLGQGAMGVVYHGWDTRLEMEVAIKVLLADPKDPATSEELKRLVREVKISRALKHPNIVSVYDVDDDLATGRTFIVMEFIQGVPLGSLPKKKILSFQDTVTLIGHVANALDYAAQAGVVHRDIKPANILVDVDTLTPKLVDFGVARLQGANMTQAQAILGTPHYMSPEQWRGEVADGRSDIFSLGVVLYELLTGQKAFPGEALPSIMMAALDPNTPVPPAEVRAGVIPLSLSHAVMRALAKNPNDRYARGTEMQKALLKSLEQPREAPPPAPRPAAPPPRPAATPPVQQAPGLDTGGLALKLQEPVQPAEEAQEGAPKKGARKGGKRSRPSTALIAGLALVVLPVAGWFGWPVVKAALMPTVAIHLGVLRHAEQGAPSVLRQGDSLLPGDRMAVYVKPKDTTYVYVLRVTPAGEVAKLFPNPAVTPQENPVLAGTELWLPAPNSVRGWFSLHDKAGQSEVIVIATADPLRRLNDPIGLLSLLDKVGPDTDEKLLGNVPQLQTKLTVGQHRGTHPAPGSSFTAPTHLLEGNGQGLYYRFQLNQL